MEASALLEGWEPYVPDKVAVVPGPVEAMPDPPKGLKPAVREAESIVLVVVEAVVVSLEEDWKPDAPDEDAVVPVPVEAELA